MTNSMEFIVEDFETRGKTGKKFAESSKPIAAMAIYPGEAAPSAAATGGGVSMTLIEKIPTLTDAEVVNLLTNARRLQDSGDERQQAAAAELLPALEAAATERKTERLAAAQAKRAAARKPRKVAA